MEIINIVICVNFFQESAGVETGFITFDMDCYTSIITTGRPKKTY